MLHITQYLCKYIYDTFVTGIRTISTSAFKFWNIIQNDSAEINVSIIYLFSRVTVFRCYWLQESAKCATCVCKKKLCLVEHGMALPSSTPWRLRKSHPDCIFIGPSSDETSLDDILGEEYHDSDGAERGSQRGVYQNDVWFTCFLQRLCLGGGDRRWPS